MHLALTAWLALALCNSPRFRWMTSATELDPDDDQQQSLPYQASAERRLLELVNRARQQAGEQPLQLDPRLSLAARQHAADMAGQKKLSHGLSDELPLTQRLASAGLHLDEEGENVAFDENIEQAHEGLMNSPAHRKNLLHANFNLVGLGVVLSGNRLYIVEDFAHTVETYPLSRVENMVAAALKHQSAGHLGPRLRRIETGNLRSQACSMAAHGKIDANALQSLGPCRYILTYISMQPQLLPTSARQPLSRNNLRTFAVGACYAQTPSYPSGAYFITVAFY